MSEIVERTTGSSRSHFPLSILLLGTCLLFLAFPSSGVAAESELQVCKGEFCSYIVVFWDWVEDPAAVAHEQVEKYGGRLGFIYKNALKGYSAEYPTSVISQVECEPTVDYVAKDQIIEIFSASSSGSVSFSTASVGSGCAGEPEARPTNLRTLTVTKSANGPGGTGSVSSKPRGIKCGMNCSEAVARTYKNTPVVLTEKPGTTSTFVEWAGACSGAASTCTVPMAEEESVEAVFAGTSKTITPTEALTVSKGKSTGKGTVKVYGSLTCEADCWSTTSLYQGPVTEPKFKVGKTVILKQAPAFGSVFLGWSGCGSVTEVGECVVVMEADREVVAEYEALPNKVLTVNKAYSSGNGAVSSKPKGIKCGATCTQAVAQMPEGAAVELTTKPGSEASFVEWEGGDCNGSTSPTCVVTMNTDETTKAVFNKPGKAFSPAETLTLSKGGLGYGTVKASGLTCEALCASTVSLYPGETGVEPKIKPGKTVILKGASASGSKAVEWFGCDSVDEEGNCVVTMSSNRKVTATFDELE